MLIGRTPQMYYEDLLHSRRVTLDSLDRDVRMECFRDNCTDSYTASVLEKHRVRRYEHQTGNPF